MPCTPVLCLHRVAARQFSVVLILGLAPILARTYRYPSKCLASLLEYLDLAVLALASLCHVITYVSYISTDRALPARRPGSAPHPLAPTGSSFGASGA